MSIWRGDSGLSQTCAEQAGSFPRGSRAAVVPRMLRRPGATGRVLPDYLVIGAQKAGTSSLLAFLEAGSDVRPALVKEVHYFDHHHRRGPGWYRSHFSRGPVDRAYRRWITGEASPYYLLHPHAAPRARDLLPEARLIAVLRNPVTRAYSHFQHSTALGVEGATEFGRALDLETERTEQDWQNLLTFGRRRHSVEWFSYVRRGRYAAQLARWRQAYPLDSLLVLTAEELSADPLAVVRRVRTHLGLQPDPPPGSRDLPRARHVRAYPPMGVREHDRLQEIYRGEIGAVEELLGRDTGWLTEPVPVR